MSARTTARSGAASKDGHSSEKTNVRILELFFGVYETPRGLLHHEIHAMVPYRHYDEHTFNVTLARDLSHLRAMGVQVNELSPAGTADNSKRYVIDRSTVGSSTDGHLTAAQIHLIESALTTMPQVSSEQASAYAYLLRARTNERVPSVSVAVESSVDNAQGLSVIIDAIERAIPLSFPYSSTTESSQRAVEPWRILLRGQGLYLWGWDLDRQAPRLFRLSRIDGPVELIGEPGDVDHPRPGDATAFDGLLCSPTVLVRDGAALPWKADLTPVSQAPATPDEAAFEDSFTVPLGWSLMRGHTHEQYVWMDRVIAHATDVVLIEPRTLREHILDGLNSWGGTHHA